MKNTDYIYTVYTKNEDGGAFKNHYTYDALCVMLREHEIECGSTPKILSAEPDWEYGDHTGVYFITRLPANAPKPEIWTPQTKQVLDL